MTDHIEISRNEKGTRFGDALNIQEGACNPSGIARALVQACAECLDNGADQRSDPAVRLIVHQLAYLCNVADIDSGSTDTYGKLVAACAQGVEQAKFDAFPDRWRVVDYGADKERQRFTLVGAYLTQEVAQACVDGHAPSKIMSGQLMIHPPSQA